MDRCVIDGDERRLHARAPAAAGHSHLEARLRTGSPLRVLDTSPDGMLVESPARLLPGRQVDLVLQSGATRVHAPWVVVHSRVGCIRGSSDLRYRVGLRRAGSNYPPIRELAKQGHELPIPAGHSTEDGDANRGNSRASGDGTQIGNEDMA
jgi:hypothetical protein